MQSAFNGCSIFNQPLNSWNPLLNQSLADTFNGCTVFNQALPSFAKSAVIAQGCVRTFVNCVNFNQDLSTWDVSNNTSFEAMFSGATSFNGSLTSWDTSKATNMIGMFNFATSFNQNVSHFDVSKVTSFDGMFQSATSFNNGGSSDINNWVLNTTLGSNVILSNMFRSSAFNQPLNNWNTTEVIRINNMFQLNTVFNQDISGWNTAKVTNMGSCFATATSFNQNLSTWSISSLTAAVDFSQNSGMSATNIDNLLIGWWAQAPSIQNNVNLRVGAATRTVASDAAVTGLTSAPYNWTISNP
jgi:surface protein